jgi:hypothetical protein
MRLAATWWRGAVKETCGAVGFRLLRLQLFAAPEHIYGGRDIEVMKTAAEEGGCIAVQWQWHASAETKAKDSKAPRLSYLKQNSSQVV